MLICSFAYLKDIGSISLLDLRVLLPILMFEIIEDESIDSEVIDFHSFVMFLWIEKLQGSICVEVVSNYNSTDHVVVSLFIDAEDGGGGIAVVYDQMEDIFGCEGWYFCVQVLLIGEVPFKTVPWVLIFLHDFLNDLSGFADPTDIGDDQADYVGEDISALDFLEVLEVVLIFWFVISFDLI